MARKEIRSTQEGSEVNGVREARNHTMLLVEAEAFTDKGGWVLDQQFMDQMGSPYLMAHGLGKPVNDATTTVKVPEQGDYRVWIRACNWTAPWSSEAAGRFECVVNGKKLRKTFGCGPEGWLWEDGGVVCVDTHEIQLRLHDLTGFNGRCDAVLLSKDLDFTPPNSTDALRAFRHDALGLPENAPCAGSYDLVVVGGGAAGLCCALSAARLGLITALIHDRPVLGGNGSSEVGVTAGAEVCLPPYPKVGLVTRDVTAGLSKNESGENRTSKDRYKWELVQAEDNLDCYLNMRLTRVEMSGDRIRSVTCQHIENGTESRFEASLFVDSSGDGNLGYLAGAAFRQGRESKVETGESLAPDKADSMKNGTSNLWFAEETQEEDVFPLCPWAISFTEEMFHPDFGDYIYKGFPAYDTQARWFWQNGWEQDTVNDAERIRDYNLLAAFGYWSFMKNESARRNEFKRWKLWRVDYVNGKRESRRLLGDHILSQHDIDDRPNHDDAFVYGTYMIDMHLPPSASYFPHGEFLLGKHIHNKKVWRHKKDRLITPYPIPFRCLYSQNVSNLMMAGRCISSTHIAHSTARIINTTGMMGEVVAMGASLSLDHDCTPRSVRQNHLEELRRLAEIGIPWVPKG
ncbi:MAG: FAD-dependent oxidoreductase [Lentisphaerae bacterium]|jgi:hypothetical protein|nr:FAD-dependent oxidoreductase [Lentisphaerota bacterium]MBT5606675.1 FAD-dependent oxidoreductase [Lentisphaerota bacterium]MBT7844239.1 FAD-dependent oxidoreductase [Lentisphaerota bacterium]